MRKYAHLYIIAFLVAALVIVDSAYLRWSDPPSKAESVEETPGNPPGVVAESVEETPGKILDVVEGAEEARERRSVAVLAEPISRARERVTKKPFGIEIHPGDSPVENDRFDGFHVGVDFETFEDEQDVDVPIFAICDGPLQFKKQAKGYGGVAVQACIVDAREVSVIYGHLDIASIAADTGQMILSGERIGVLGEGYSEETDGVRKHLHLGIRERSYSDIRGYVKSPEEIAAYLDILGHLP